MTPEYNYHLNGRDVREVTDWGSAVVLWHEVIPARVVPGYFTSKGKYVKPHWQTVSGIRECQNWRKTIRAYARVHGYAVAIFCDDTAISFARQANGRVRQSERHPATITWKIAA